MKPFLDEDFLLQTNTAKKLYHDFAAKMPIIDYHNHLPPEQISSDKMFDNITQVWLSGDHYKWRAMRANGVNERFCTGDASDREKFDQWAATVPYTLRNPLYHWTHLELKRYFGIKEILSPETSARIWDECNEKLKSPEFSVRGMLTMMNVKVVCTTDDPLDKLDHHQKISADGFSIKVLPAFRPDKAMNADDLQGLNNYIDKLQEIENVSIADVSKYLEALKNRHNYFAANGCTISDHGMDRIYADDWTEEEVDVIFKKIRSSQPISVAESSKFKSAMLEHFALWDHEKGWVQQYHLGALRNNNSRKFKELGPDTGWDSIGEFTQAQTLSKFLSKLDNNDQLTRTILYNLNPSHNEVFAAMIGNFNDGSAAGKMQFGSGWWFLDQKDGMTKQLNALSNLGLLSRFVGMLTDSRSFMSFPRHEYFRRIVCNLFGSEVEAGELPNDVEWIGKIVQDISFNNAKSYFNF
ncbi:glucuronate isomerase [Daejeonella lutea]|uniref:Uronate isomerase n=1 Tax=Daejeonella lutea TaxID=572036 RepID=A0A1T5BBZ4_9SPHI|nr:glucuronate isomerase [Daejeonella lutea]SKB44821.1 glucuronate isomerase [Daejeonella lutea]